MELYPCSERHPRPSRVRLGFRATREALDRLQASGLLQEPPRLIRSQAHVEVYLVSDPDENALELEVSACSGAGA